MKRLLVIVCVLLSFNAFAKNSLYNDENKISIYDFMNKAFNQVQLNPLWTDDDKIYYSS